MTKAQEVRQQRKIKNLCQHCGGEFDSELHAECLEKLKKRRQSYRNLGLCRDCRKSVHSKEHFDTCVVSRRIVDGHCPRCKDNIQSEAHKECLKKQRASKKLIYNRAIANGLCAGHTNRAAVVKGKCEECWFRSLARNSLGSKTNWVQLKNLLVDQNYKCAYTGDTLIPGDNASLDHRIPVSRCGTRTIDNVQWTTLKINIIKGPLTHEEFLLICEHNWNNQFENPDDRTKAMVQVWEHMLSLH